MDTIRPYGPGKFNTLIDSLVWNLLQEGTDEELAEQGFGWKALFKVDGAPLNIQVQEENKDTQLNVAESQFLQEQIGLIASEDEDGFATVSYFDDPVDLDSAWSAIQADYATYIDEDGMEPPPVEAKHAAAQHIRKVSGSEIEHTMHKVVATLYQGGIPSLVVGGYAVQEHGYPRFTHDVDLVVPNVAEAKDYLSIRGFKPNPGSNMTLTDRETKVEVDLLPAGGHVGPGPLALPQSGPLSATPNIVDLSTLIAIKLSSYMGSRFDRMKDASDVIELIKANGLPRNFPQTSAVRETYQTLWDGLHEPADYQNHG